MTQLTGAVTWIIGASSGIGAAVARELQRRGATVVVSARREERLRELADGELLVVPLDVTDADAVEAAGRRIRERCGRIDVVVIAAGYWQQLDPRDWDASAFRHQVEVNLIGTSNAIAAVLPDMLRRRAGVIAGIASVAGYRGLPGAAAYGATKAGQINLLESLRTQTSRTGVRVVTVCPGFVRTQLTDQNSFSMPFMIEPDAAARAICDGIEKGRSEIVFPRRMAVLAKAARLVPVAVWTALWRRASLP